MKELRHITFRSFFRRSFRLCLFLVVLWALWLEPDSLTVVHRDVPSLPGLAALKGKRAAVIADIHAGSLYIDEGKVADIVARTQAEKPDIIFLLGDYLGHGLLSNETDVSHIEILKYLDSFSAPLGVYAVLGNHDGQIAPALRKLKGRNIILLDNKNAVVRTDKKKSGSGASLVIAGFADHGSDRIEGFGTQLADHKGESAICLTHSPSALEIMPPECALTLAGDAHGGIVNLPLIGAPFSEYGNRYVSGFVTEKGRLMFISPGIGTSGIPIRLGAQPEITLLHFN